MGNRDNHQQNTAPSSMLLRRPRPPSQLPIAPPLPHLRLHSATTMQRETRRHHASPHHLGGVEGGVFDLHAVIAAGGRGHVPQRDRVGQDAVVSRVAVAAHVLGVPRWRCGPVQLVEREGPEASARLVLSPGIGRGVAKEGERGGVRRLWVRGVYDAPCWTWALLGRGGSGRVVGAKAEEGVDLLTSWRPARACALQTTGRAVPLLPKKGTPHGGDSARLLVPTYGTNSILFKGFRSSSRQSLLIMRRRLFWADEPNETGGAGRQAGRQADGLVDRSDANLPWRRLRQ